MTLETQTESRLVSMPFTRSSGAGAASATSAATEGTHTIAPAAARVRISKHSPKGAARHIRASERSHLLGNMTSYPVLNRPPLALLHSSP